MLEGNASLTVSVVLPKRCMAIQVLYLVIKDIIKCRKMQTSNESFEPIALKLEKLCADWNIDGENSKRAKPIQLARYFK